MGRIGLTSLRRLNRGKRSCTTLALKTRPPTKKFKVSKRKTKESSKDALLRRDATTLKDEEIEILANHLRNTSQYTMRMKNRSVGTTQKTANRKKSEEKGTSHEENDSNETVYSNKWDETLNIEDLEMEKIKPNELKKQQKTLGNEIGCLPKVNEIRQNVKKVEWDEIEKQIFYEEKIRQNIANDPELFGYYDRKIKPRIDKTVMTTMAKILYRHFNEENGKVVKKGTDDIIFNSKLMKYVLNGRYNPPKERLLIIGEKSKNWQTNAFVYSDIPKEEPATTTIPKTLLYKYTNKNCINEKKYPALESITKEAEKKIIKCDCCSGGTIKKCWQNPNCPCYKMNIKLRNFQNVTNHVVHEKTNFSTFKPILLRDSDPYFDTIGFACSEECECKGKCTNNVTFLLEKEIVQLELFRKSEVMGFGLRSNAFIPAGTPVAEFTGVMIHGDVPKSEDDYAYAVFSESDTFSVLIPQLFSKTSRFIAEMKKQFEKEERWFINPKHIGNIARTCCHSCEPNLTLVRVFQKGFSPAHCRLLLVTQEVIFPGVEMTFDYGPGYIRETLGNNCLCNKAGCISSKVHSAIEKSSQKSLEKYQALRYHFGYTQFKKEVLDAIEKKDNQ